MDRSAEITAKTARVVRMLAEESLCGALIISQHNFAWLTAGGTSGVDTSREPGGGALLIRNDGKRFVLASRIEMQRLLSEELGGEDFEPIEFAWEEEKASPTLVANRAISLLNNNGPLGSDITIGPTTSPIESSLARCRYQLTVSEIGRFRSLGSDAAQAVGDVVRNIVPGETESEVARRTADALAAHNIRAVVNLVAADERIRNYRHPIPTDRRWEKVLLVAVCARRGGLTASLTRIVCDGVIPKGLRERTLATARVNARLLAATTPGTTGADLYDLAARAYSDEGFAGEERLHHQGGSCGYRTRDWVAHPRCAETVQVNQAFAWNPSITGTKVEETCIAFADDLEVLTVTRDWPQIPVLLEGREYLSPDVLRL